MMIFIYTDPFTIFIKLTDINPRTRTAVTMFLNVATRLPMGTIQPFGEGDNKLYTYNPSPDDPPPKVRDLSINVVTIATRGVPVWKFWLLPISNIFT